MAATIMPENKVCPFCLDQLGEAFLELPCKHVMHIACYEEIMEYNRCPVCRKVIDPCISVSEEDQPHEEEFMDEYEYEGQVLMANLRHLVGELPVRDIIFEQLHQLLTMENRDEARNIADMMLGYVLDLLPPEDVQLIMIEMEALFY